jgi:hypothetical protein
MAIVKLAPEYTSDDLASDLQHLFDLVDTVVVSLVGIDQSKLDCAEKGELNRACSLIWIARDQIEIIMGHAFPENDAGAGVRAMAEG